MAVINSTSESDLLDGSSEVDTIRGGDGDDTLSGFAGGDFLNGNLGDDRVRGLDDNDTVHGGSGSDFVNGNKGNDSVFGDDGDDIIHGGQGDDTVDGGDGNDTIFGDKGSDSIIGGAGMDVIVYSGNFADYQIIGSGGNYRIIDNSGDDGTDIVSGIEILQFADFTRTNDQIALIASATSPQSFTLTVNADNLLGFGVSDTFTTNMASLNTNDSLNGGSADDILKITDGATITDANFTANILGIEIIELTAGNNHSVTLGTNSQVTGITKINGSSIGVANTLTVNTTSRTTVVTVLGGEGADVITSGNLNESISGNGGGDTFNFQVANFNASDTINGGAGTDTLAFSDGGIFNLGTLDANVSAVEEITVTTASTITFGTDTYKTTGSGGADKFIFTEAQFTSADEIVGGAGTDTISITTAATLTTAEVNKLSGIEVIEFGGAGNTVTLTDTFVNASDTNSVELVNAGNSITTLDISNVNSARTVVIGGTGTVTLETTVIKAITIYISRITY